jgi:hypothetical protein
LLVAESADADRIGLALRRNHPELEVLRIVDTPSQAPASNEIQRPFTQSALLQKATMILEKRGAAAATSS